MERTDYWSPSSTMTTNLTMEPSSPWHFMGQPAMVHPHTLKFIDVTTDVLPRFDAIAKQDSVAGFPVGEILNDLPAAFSFCIGCRYTDAAVPVGEVRWLSPAGGPAPADQLRRACPPLSTNHSPASLYKPGEQQKYCILSPE
jgi:hypothetical protein